MIKHLDSVTIESSKHDISHHTYKIVYISEEKDGRYFCGAKRIA
jgi:hypothetical protein